MTSLPTGAPWPLGAAAWAGRVRRRRSFRRCRAGWAVRHRRGRPWRVTPGWLKKLWVPQVMAHENHENHGENEVFWGILKAWGTIFWDWIRGNGKPSLPNFTIWGGVKNYMPPKMIYHLHCPDEHPKNEENNWDGPWVKIKDQGHHSSCFFWVSTISFWGT